VFPIQIPALRERTEDIPQLVWPFVDEFSDSLGKEIKTIADENMRELQQYGWPGNIRELRDAVERAMILAAGPLLSIFVPRRATARPARLPPETKREILRNVGEISTAAGGPDERVDATPARIIPAA
jgi:DNA-binding NtrC family response regulator